MSIPLLEPKVKRKIGTVHVIKKLEEGISIKTIKNIASYLNISINDLMTYLRISLSTWHRRKKTGKMDFDSSDKILQVSQLIEYGENIFGSQDKITAWLKTRSIVFDNKRPLELIGSLSGINLINEELIRIEHGVFI